MKTVLVLLLVSASPLTAQDLRWIDRYDWYKDSYIMGWKSETLSLVYNPKVGDIGNGTVSTDVRLDDIIGFRYELSTRGRDDWGPSMRVAKSGEWSAYIEPSWGRGEPGIFVKTPYGPIGKLKLSTAKNRQLAWKGLERGAIEAVMLKGTKPPKGGLVQIAEHVGVRGLRRLLIGSGVGLEFILVEALLKRVLRLCGGIFGGLFDGPHTRGLTVSRQTLSDEYLERIKRKSTR